MLHVRLMQSEKCAIVCHNIIFSFQQSRSSVKKRSIDQEVSLNATLTTCETEAEEICYCMLSFLYSAKQKLGEDTVHQSGSELTILV